jgi:hypothetical protein
VTTDEVILAGYAAQSPGAFRIAGSAFSEERYGIGMKKGDSELRAKINDALAKMEQEGAWKAAFERNLGPAGIPTPAPPANRTLLTDTQPGFHAATLVWRRKPLRALIYGWVKPSYFSC